MTVYRLSAKTGQFSTPARLKLPLYVRTLDASGFEQNKSGLKIRGTAVKLSSRKIEPIRIQGRFRNLKSKDEQVVEMYV